MTIPSDHDATWDAADWQPQRWDGNQWVDADPPPSAPRPSSATAVGGQEEIGDDGDEEWEYHEVEIEPDHQRQAVVVGGVAITVLLLLAAVVVALTGGSSTDDVAAGGTTLGTKAAGASAPPRKNSALTGLPTDPAKLTRPALVAKIDNVNDGARPQSGINQADIVFEEKVEGPNSRFAAIFQSADAPLIGPIRSGRTTDLSILDALNKPLFVFSGANSTFRPLFAEANIVDLGADDLANASLYERVAGREAPYNLYSDTNKVWAKAGGDRPPRAMFSFRKADEGPSGGRPVAGLRYEWGGGKNPVAFTWDATKRAWTRVQNDTPHVDDKGVQIAPANVLVFYVDYIDTGVRDVAGTAVPEAVFDGTGEALVFTDGQLVQAMWSKAAESPVVVADKDGKAVGLTPGRTWIALVPKGLATVVNRTETPPPTR